MKDTIVLAYSGGLDTSVAQRWLADIIGTVAGDDTVLCVVGERAGSPKVAKRLSALAGL